MCSGPSIEALIDEPVSRLHPVGHGYVMAYPSRDTSTFAGKRVHPLVPGNLESKEDVVNIQGEEKVKR